MSIEQTEQTEPPDLELACAELVRAFLATDAVLAAALQQARTTGIQRQAANEVFTELMFSAQTLKETVGSLSEALGGFLERLGELHEALKREASAS